MPTLPTRQLLRVTRGDTLVGYFGASGKLTAAVPFSGRFYPYGVTFLSESGELQVSVVDANGNRSPGVTIVLPACVVPDAVVVDAGRSDRPPDASATTDASTSDASTSDAGVAIDVGQPAGEDDGCALGRADGMGALWLALALVLSRRKRR